MRLLTVIATLIAMSFVLGGCAGIGEVFGSDAAKFLNDAVTKGEEIGDDVLRKTAVAADVYCDDAPDVVKAYIWAGINEHTVNNTVTLTCEPKQPENPSEA